MAKLFAASPYLASVGEPYFLLDPADQKYCRPCDIKGVPCPVITKEFYESGLTDDNLYSRVAKQFGKDTIVVSEKYRERYEAFVEPGTMGGIVLFKSPENLVASEVRRRPGQPNVVLNTLKEFVDVYGDIEKWCKKMCKTTVFVNYEEFSKNHIGFINAIVQKFDLKEFDVPTDMSNLEYHYIWGSPRVHRAIKVEEDTRWMHELDNGVKDIIANHVESRRVFDNLRRLSKNLLVAS